MMTSNQNQPRPRYWHILAPQTQFPRPRLHFGLQVGSQWYDEFGNRHYDIGIIIGMQYGATGYNPEEWTYQLRRLQCNSSPWMQGEDDGYFIYESNLVLDNTDLGHRQ